MMLEKILKSNAQVFLVFVAASILLRFLSFHYSVIDHDESTYLIIADAVLNGSYLYADVIDTKPPGIFLAFGLIQVLFGKSIVALRIVGSIFLAGSAWLLYKTSKLLSGEKYPSFFAGITYLVLFSLYRFGLSVNTELFFSFFTLVGLYYFLKKESSTKLYSWFLAGLFIGIAFIFKYTVLAGFGAFCIYFLIQSVQRKEDVVRLIFKLFIATIGLLLPFFLVNVYFFSVGRFGDFYEIIYMVTSRYSSTFSWTESFLFFLKFILAYIPFVVFYLFSFRNSKLPKNILLISLLWFSFAWVMVILPGKPFRHYFLQLLPAFSLLIPYGFEKLILTRIQFPNKKIIAFCLGIILVIGFVNQSYFLVSKDIPREIAKELESVVNSNDLILADKHLHATYYLLDLKHPSPYVHPTLIHDHAKAFDINTEEEMDKILDKEPKFIVYHKFASYFESHPRIQESYHFYSKIGKVTILEINS